MNRLSFSLLTFALTLLWSVPAYAQRSTENRKVDLGEGGGGSDAASNASGGGSFLRTIVGLAIVCGLIYGLYWFLRKVKGEPVAARRSGDGLEQVASLPVGTNRSLHLVRVGSELVLVGSAEHGITPIRRYGPAEARALGLDTGEAEAIAALNAMSGDQQSVLQLEPPAAANGSTAASDGSASAAGKAVAANGSGPQRPRSHDTFANRALDTLRKSTVRG